MGALIPFFLEYAMKKNQVMPLLLAAIWMQPLSAAPMDAFLNAVSHYRAGTTQVEIAYDVVNKALDPFGIRANDPVYGGTNVGDYSGYHLRGGYGLTDNLWLEGGLWQRKIAYRNDIEDITSWQAAAQYRLTDKDRPDAQYAVRLGIWGDSAPVVNKSTPTNIQNINFQSISVGKPQDFQMQADLIGTWPVANHTLLSAFAGVGVSRITVGALTGKVNGCNYNINSNALGTYASLNAPCGNLLSATLSSPSTLAQWLSYNSRYYQAGGNVQWKKENWQLNVGYQFQYLNRNELDAAIVQRGGIAYQSNHIVVAEVARNVGKGIVLFARGQVMSNQFVGEIPLTFNSVTANKFGRLYGYASFGSRWTF
jgi:hypothetical protein